MNRKPPSRRTKAPAYRQAFERLDEALAKTAQANDTESMKRARLALFGSAPDSEEIPK